MKLKVTVLKNKSHYMLLPKCGEVPKLIMISMAKALHPELKNCRETIREVQMNNLDYGVLYERIGI